MNITKITVGICDENCYILSEGAEAVIVDPGDEPLRILAELMKTGAKARYIILTHSHFDHVLAVNCVAKKTGAKIVVGRLEVPYLHDAALSGPLRTYVEPALPIWEDIVVDDGDRIPFAGGEIEFRHTPGHTVGAICAFFRDVMFSGDTLLPGTVGRTDLPGGEMMTLLRTVQGIAELDRDWTIYPGHGPVTTLGEERLSNPFIVGKQL